MTEFQQISLLDDPDDFGTASSFLSFTEFTETYNTELKEHLQSYLDSLDEYQEEVVLFPKDSLIRCSASAGSGKTRILITRALRMMIYDNVKPEELLLITFTNKSAKEIKNRIIKFYIDFIAVHDLKIAIEDIKVPQISTIHSLGLHLIRKDFGIRRSTLSEYKAIKLIREIMNDIFDKKGESRDKQTTISEAALVYKIIDSIYSNNEIHHFFVPHFDYTGNFLFHKSPTEISEELYNAIHKTSYSSLEAQVFTATKTSTKNNIATSITHLSEEIKSHYSAQAKMSTTVFRQILSAFLSEKFRMNVMTFSDMLYFPSMMMLQWPKLHPHLQGKYQYVFVDEAQDLSSQEFQLISILAKSNNVLMCFDSKQTLYAWRDANPNIAEFLPLWFDKPILKGYAKANYRSPKQLVQLANEFASTFTEFEVQPSKPINSARKDCLTVSKFASIHEEVNWIAKQIVKKVKSGTKYKDIAILTRSNRTLVSIEGALISHGLPYYVKYDNRTMIRQSSFRFLFSMYSLLINPKDVSSFVDLISFLKGIGGSFSTKLRKHLLTAVEKDRNFSVFTSLFENDMAILRQVQTGRTKDFKLTKKHTTLISFFKEIMVPLRAIFLAPQTSTKILNTNLLSILQKKCSFDGDVSRDDGIKDSELKKQSFKDFGLKLDDSLLLKSISIINNIYDVSMEEQEFRQLMEFQRFEKIYDTLLLSQESQEDEDDFLDVNHPGKVTITTIHSSKGKEWDYVFGASLNPLMPPRVEDLEWERCVFYVLVTRARLQLNLTFSNLVTDFKNRLRPSIASKYLNLYVESLNKLKKDNLL